MIKENSPIVAKKIRQSKGLFEVLSQACNDRIPVLVDVGRAKNMGQELAVILPMNMEVPCATDIPLTTLPIMRFKSAPITYLSKAIDNEESFVILRDVYPIVEIFPRHKLPKDISKLKEAKAFPALDDIEVIQRGALSSSYSHYFSKVCKEQRPIIAVSKDGVERHALIPINNDLIHGSYIASEYFSVGDLKQSFAKTVKDLKGPNRAVVLQIGGYSVAAIVDVAYLEHYSRSANTKPVSIPSRSLDIH